jgi:hypothetical protein
MTLRQILIERLSYSIWYLITFLLNVRKKRYIIWKTCKLADPLPVCSLFAEKYGKITKFTFSSLPQFSTQWLEKYVFRTTKPIDFSSRNNF